MYEFTVNFWTDDVGDSLNYQVKKAGAEFDRALTEVKNFIDSKQSLLDNKICYDHTICERILGLRMDAMK